MPFSCWEQGHYKDWLSSKHIWVVSDLWSAYFLHVSLRKPLWFIFLFLIIFICFRLAEMFYFCTITKVPRFVFCQISPIWRFKIPQECASYLPACLSICLSVYLSISCLQHHMKNDVWNEGNFKSHFWQDMGFALWKKKLNFCWVQKSPKPC